MLPRTPNNFVKELPPSEFGSFERLPTIPSPDPFQRKLLYEVVLSFVINTTPFTVDASAAVLTCVTSPVGL